MNMLKRLLSGNVKNESSKIKVKFPDYTGDKTRYIRLGGCIAGGGLVGFLIGGILWLIIGIIVGFIVGIIFVLYDEIKNYS